MPVAVPHPPYVSAPALELLPPPLGPQAHPTPSPRSVYEQEDLIYQNASYIISTHRFRQSFFSASTGARVNDGAQNEEDGLSPRNRPAHTAAEDVDGDEVDGVTCR